MQDPRDSETSSQNLEEEEEAFIDVNDPSQAEILDDGSGPAPEEDDDDDDDDGEGDDGTVSNASVPVDKIPERDDSVAKFTQSADGKALHAVAVSPIDPTLMATGGESDEIYIVKEGALIATLKGHTDSITQLAFSPDGTMLASGCMDATVKLWDTTKWVMLHDLADLSGDLEVVLWHPSSLAVVGCARDAQTVLWNAKKGAVAQYLVGHRGPVTAAVWAADHKKLVTGSSDGSVIVFSPKTGEVEHTFATKDMSSDAAGVTVLKQLRGDIWAAGCEDGTIHILNLATGKVVHHLEELHEQSIEAMEVQPKLGFFFTASCDAKLVIWDLSDFKKRAALEVGEGVTCAQWHGEYIIAGCTDADVRIWDGRAATSEPVAQLQGHRRMITSLLVASASKLLLTTSDDGTQRAFPLPDAELA